MYEANVDAKLPIGSISAFPNNLSVFYLENKNITYACISHKSQVNILSWDSKFENINSDNIPIKDVNTDKSLIVLQAKFVLPSCRTFPLVVVASSGGAMIFDIRSHRMLSWNPLDVALPEVLINNELNLFTRGITWVDNTILVGSYTGEILMFSCSGESSVQIKRSLTEHKNSIADIATCRFDDLTCSADVSGAVIVWSKNVKSVNKKIMTDQQISVINVLRKQVIVGTYLGHVLFFSTQNGEFMADVHAHCRPVTSIAVAPESAYVSFDESERTMQVMCCGEDAGVRVFKLHTRKPEAYQVEYRYGEEMENEMCVGVQFTNGRGSGFVVASYDSYFLHLYKIAKKAPAQPKDP